MKKSTKILIVLSIIFLVPTIFLGKYVLQGIVPNDGRFYFSFSMLGILGIIASALFSLFSTILYVHFLKSQKLVGAIFFSMAPLTLVYGALVLLLTDVKNMNGVTAEAVRATLNIGQGGDYNNYLWIVLATLGYLFAFLLVLFFLCGPLSRVEKVSRQLGDGRVKQENYKIGGGRQFREIEHSLNRINYNIKQRENKLKQVDFSKQKSLNKNFYKFLGKKETLDLECGNPVKKEATLLLCELKNIGMAKDEISLKDSYEFLNSYLKIVSPLIKKHNGFVDKYLGTGLLAVFPNAKDAVDCSHAILKAVKVKNRNLKTKIDALLVIHSAVVTFGLVGEEKIPSIISNELETLKKMQERNVLLGTKMLISKDSLNTIKQNFAFAYRFVSVFEKNYLYESLEYYSKRQKEKLKKMKNKMENGVQLLFDGDYQKAKECFSSILHTLPNDNVSFVYFNQATENLNEAL